MLNLKKIILTFIIITLAFGIISCVKADAEENTDSSTNTEEQISAEDLGVKDPSLLPDNLFYFLKEWTRKIRVVFTFNEVKKAELESKFSNEKLIELKKLVKNGVNPEKIKKATENYQNAIDKIKERTDKIKDNAEDNPEVNKFLEKFTNQQVLQEKILQKLETQVPQEVFEKIKEAREQHLERFKDVMTKLQENKDKIAEKIKNALQNGDESNIEILEKIKEKMPEDIKQKLESIKENVREKVNDKLIEKATEKNENKNCPIVSKPAPDFCKNGIIKVKRDEKGCATGFNCLIPSWNKKCQTDADCRQPSCELCKPMPDCQADCPKAKCVEGKCKINRNQ